MFAHGGRKDSRAKRVLGIIAVSAAVVFVSLFATIGLAADGQISSAPRHSDCLTIATPG